MNGNKWMNRWMDGWIACLLGGRRGDLLLLCVREMEIEIETERER